MLKSDMLCAISVFSIEEVNCVTLSRSKSIHIDTDTEQFKMKICLLTFTNVTLHWQASLLTFLMAISP